MRQIRYLILLAWLTPVLLLLSPVHDYANVANPLYVGFVIMAIVALTAGIRVEQVHLTDSILRSKFVANMNLLCAAFLLLATIATIYSVVSSGGGLRENREIFESRHALYNYIFVSMVFSAIILSVSPWAGTLARLVGRSAWMCCGVLLLMTGNRQFVFFSLIFLTVYFLGKSPAPGRLFLRVGAGGVLVIGLAVVFSFLRLDYIEAEHLGAYGQYVSILTGAFCEAGEYCLSWVEAVFQLLYAYLGMNYTGLTYAIDFYGAEGGFPVGSTSFPVFYRRFESAGMVEGIDRYTVAFDSFIARESGGEYAHFFLSMFGTVALETGFTGLLVMVLVLALVVRVLANRIARQGDETFYFLFVFVCCSMVFGLMQFPLTEPFLTFGLLNLLAHCLLATAGRTGVAEESSSPLAGAPATML